MLKAIRTVLVTDGETRFAMADGFYAIFQSHNRFPAKNQPLKDRIDKARAEHSRYRKSGLTLTPDDSSYAGSTA
jgi:hypothetical protein